MALAASSLIAMAQARPQVLPAPPVAASSQPTGDGMENFRRELEAAPMTIIGDTNHADTLIKIVSSDAVLDLLQATGKKYLGIEDDVYSQPAVDELAEGRITADEFMKLRTAQMEARGEVTFHRDAQDLLADTTALIVKAAQRGIRVICFDESEGLAGPLRIYGREVRKDYAAYKKNGGKETLDAFADHREDDNFNKFLDAVIVNRVGGRVNAHMLSNMTHTMRQESKHPLLPLDHASPHDGFVLFIGSGHAPKLAEKAERRGIESRTVLLFGKQDQIPPYDKLQSELNHDDHLALPLTSASKYLIFEGNIWHSPQAPALPQPELRKVAPPRIGEP